ncbi:hypothetical protein GCM10010421_32540 [Streptomyces glaucus]|uniref:Uncharacterized protein n=2 Tax=Streptomyces glaucus TaxID=284029 RepID=A0ABN3JT41_9ACTN
MAALRAWAEPGLRARLIKAAWDAGNQNVNELAEAARVDRKTVYADLAAEGIDPKTDRTQGGTVLEPISINGLYGDERDEHLLGNKAIAAVLDAFRDCVPDQAQADKQATQEFRLRMHASAAASWHNTLLPLAQAALERRRDAERALRLWHTAYEALGEAKTSEWAAAHHRFIRAWQDARRAVEEQQTAEAAMRDKASTYMMQIGEVERRLYEENVPAEQRITIPEDDHGRHLEMLEDVQKQRAATAAQTLRLLGGLAAG